VPANHPAASDPGDNRSGFEGVVEEIQRDLCNDGTTVHCPREVVAGTVIACAVHGPQRAAVDGTAGAQPIVPVVRWAG